MDEKRREHLKKAFDLVCPRKNAEKLVELGLVSKEDIQHVSWRDPIVEVLAIEDLVKENVTLADLEEAVEFFTATKANVSPCMVGGRDDLNFLGAVVNGVLVEAAGYRAGPAGP